MEIQTATETTKAKKPSKAAATPETPLANVDANMFRAAYVCASREETRYYLNGVYIEPHKNGGALLIAADGHRMIVIHDESAFCSEPCIVGLSKAGLDACRPVKDVKPDVKVPRLVVSEDGSAYVEGQWRSPGKVTIDGTFPDWRRVVPFEAKWSGAVASFNPKLIAGFGEIKSILRQEKNPGAITILTSGEGDPALIDLGDFRTAFGILMPMRSSPLIGLPPWMKPIQDAVRAEKAAKLAADAKKAKEESDAAAAAIKLAARKATRAKARAAKAKAIKKKKKARR